MNRWTTLAVGVAAGAVLSLAIYVGAAPAGPATPLRVGIVDFSRLLQAYGKMKDAEKTMVTLQDGIREQGKARRDALDALQTKLQMHTPGSEAYAATEKELTTKSAELETWTKLKARELLERERNYIRDVYTDVEKTAAEYARANGISLVLKSDKLDLSSPSVRELDFRVTLKQILYSAQDMDITDALLGVLNERYEKQKALEGAVKGGAK